MKVKFRPKNIEERRVFASAKSFPNAKAEVKIISISRIGDGRFWPKFWPNFGRSRERRELKRRDPFFFYVFVFLIAASSDPAALFSPFCVMAHFLLNFWQVPFSLFLKYAAF